MEEDKTNNRVEFKQIKYLSADIDSCIQEFVPAYGIVYTSKGIAGFFLKKSVDPINFSGVYVGSDAERIDLFFKKGCGCYF